MENTMWNGLGYLPRHSGSSICAILRQLRGSGSLESNTEQLFSRRLFIMQRKRPSGEKPTSWPGEKILSNVTSQRSEEHTSELQSHSDLVCRLLLRKKN